MEDYKWYVSGEEFGGAHYIFIGFPFLFTKCPVLPPTHQALWLHAWNKYCEFRRPCLYIKICKTKFKYNQCFHSSDLLAVLVLWRARRFCKICSKITSREYEKDFTLPFTRDEIGIGAGHWSANPQSLHSIVDLVRVRFQV